jgi:hypothetical protein
MYMSPNCCAAASDSVVGSAVASAAAAAASLPAVAKEGCTSLPLKQPLLSGMLQPFSGAALALGLLYGMLCAGANSRHVAGQLGIIPSLVLGTCDLQQHQHQHHHMLPYKP